jgi:hypothetical protein
VYREINRNSFAEIPLIYDTRIELSMSRRSHSGAGFSLRDFLPHT